MNFAKFLRTPLQNFGVCFCFSKNFGLNLENIVQGKTFLVVAIGDFNARSSKWHCQNKSSFKGNVIDNITSQFGLSQVIKAPTHILNASFWCIDHIFTPLPNLIIDSGIHSPHTQTVIIK